MKEVPSKNISMANLSRRSFLKATAATCLAASMMTACSSGDSQDDTFVPDNNDLDRKAGTWHKSFCGSCIWTNCGTEIKVQNGIGIELRGNMEHPSNKGTLCPRGAAMLMGTYNPYRVKTPMRRTNPVKGVDVDPGWVEISWDEAMNTVVNKIKAVEEPDLANVYTGLNFRQVAFWHGFAANSHESPFMKLLEGGVLTPNYHTTAGPLCEVHHAPTKFNATFVDRIDFGYCNYIVALGRNMGSSVAYASGGTRGYLDALERGMKLVSIDPRVGTDVSKGGNQAEWVPIKPATDQAFLMSMLHQILWVENVFDEEAMRWRSNAPYLIRQDGSFLREGYTAGVAPTLEETVNTAHKPLIMGVDGVLRDFTNYVTKDDGGVLPSFLYTTDTAWLTNFANKTGIDINNDPDWKFATTAENWNGELIETAFVKLLKSVENSTPEWSAAITDIPAAKVREITSNFISYSRVKEAPTITLDGVTFPLRPAAVAIGRGAANNMQGQRAYTLADIINLVVGGMGVPGSIVTASEPSYTFEDGLERYHSIGSLTTARDPLFQQKINFDYKGQHFYPLAFFTISGFAMGAILDPQKYGMEYDIKVLFAHATNPVTNNASRGKSIDVMKKVPFVFAVSTQMDETAMFCDILLPEHSHYERNQIRPIDETMAVTKETIQLRGMMYKERAIDLVYNTRQFDEIFVDIMASIGLTPKLNMWVNGFFGQPHGWNDLGTPVPLADPQLDPGTKYSYQEMMSRMLKAFPGNYDTEWYKEHGFNLTPTPLRKCYEYYSFQVEHRNDATERRTGRIPVYNADDFAAGEFLRRNVEQHFGRDIPGWEGKMQEVYNEYTPVPAWFPNFVNADSPDYDSEFDMYAINWKITVRNLGLGGQDDNVWLREIVDKHDFDSFDIHIHPETATAKGLKNGDRVKITSRGNKQSDRHDVYVQPVMGTVKLTNLIAKNCVGFPGQAGRIGSMVNPICRKGTNYNLLLSNTEGLIQPDSGAVPISVNVKIEKA